MSTQQQLAVTYDVSNDFFRLWLDKRMNYSCALFTDGAKTLEDAQINKLLWFYNATKLTPQSRVIDIGCGWGGNLEFLSKDMGLLDITGITLSKAQYLEVAQKALPGVKVYCQSYIDFKHHQLFDAAISIGMFEHLATPEQARSGESLDIYRNYFRLVWQWTRPGARFGLQSVISELIPRDPQSLRDLAWTTQHIFPGAVSPRLEIMISALLPFWEIVELHTRREHYQKTTEEWLNRLIMHEAEICKQWGENTFLDYKRYLSACVEMFSAGYQSLVQMVLIRLNHE